MTLSWRDQYPTTELVHTWSARFMRDGPAGDRLAHTMPCYESTGAFQLVLADGERMNPTSARHCWWILHFPVPLEPEAKEVRQELSRPSTVPSYNRNSAVNIGAVSFASKIASYQFSFLSRFLDILWGRHLSCRPKQRRQINDLDCASHGRCFDTVRPSTQTLPTLRSQ